MSLILDALSRSEREKRAGESPIPDILDPVAVAPARGGRPRWMWALGACILLVILVVIIRLLTGGAEMPATTSEAPLPGSLETEALSLPSPSPASLEPETLPPPSPSPGSLSGSPRPAPVKTDSASSTPREAIAALYSEARETADREPSVATAGVPPSVAAESRRLAASDIEPARAGEPSPGDVAVSESPVDVEALLREVHRAAERDGLAPHATPLLGDLSRQFRDSVPTLMYRQHDFNAQGRSTVMLNGQTLREGQRNRGVEVVDILADSVILRFTGTEFRLRALNSWVNL